MKKGIRNFNFHLKNLFRAYLLGVVLFFLSRIVFFIRINNGTIIGNYNSDLLHAFFIGARFDTMVLMYGFIIPVLLAFISLFIEKRGYQDFVSGFYRYYLNILLFIFSLILVIDIFYYDYFQSHINVLFFGFFEDDTEAVMKSVWTDYPLIRVLIVLGVIYFFIAFILKRAIRIFPQNSHQPPFYKGILYALLSLCCFFAGMRGSFGTFPLQIDDATISENTTVNLLPMNGVFALKEAWLTRKKEMNIEGNIKWLRQIGYGSHEKAVQDYFSLSSDSFKPDSLKNYYFLTTGENNRLSSNPPHVILFLMESMSNYNLSYHSRELNLLGALEKYWNSEILFRRCLPFGNGTINTLEGLLVNTPVTSLAQSSNRYISYSSSVALPFKNAGYQTTYVTGGKLGWRNINEFIPRQFFDFVEGNANILQEVEGTKECEWGVYDEYLFEHVFKKLEKSGGKPQMIFAMTTTNHTPFNLPDHYKPYPVNIDKELERKLLTDKKMAVNNFTNLQYSNNCLGLFLDKLKASPYGNNTIVAATGDHNNLMLFDFASNQILEKRGVPLFFSIPGQYLAGHKADTSLFASHKDIFPTLINLALPGARYFNAGSFLFDTAMNARDYFSIDLMSKEAMNFSGAVHFDPDPLFYEWNDKKTILNKTDNPSADLLSLLQRSRAYYASMSYFIGSEIRKVD